jgi:hypothetical protein
LTENLYIFSIDYTKHNRFASPENISEGFNVTHTNKTNDLTDSCKLFNSAETCITVFPDCYPRQPKNISEELLEGVLLKLTYSL